MSVIKDQCISITDLRKETKKCLSRLQSGEKYIFVNNKPKAVIMDIDTYENLKINSSSSLGLIELPEKEITTEIKKELEKTKKIKKEDLLNI